jgi:thioredoxin reductase (NADPH)
MPRPVFFVVAEDGPRLEALTRDLQRRYDADYDVVGTAAAATALTMLKDLANTGVEVALLIADERLTEIPAVDLLARAHDLHPGGKRILLIERGDWSAAHPAVTAMATGQIDYHLYAPWHPAERIPRRLGQITRAGIGRLPDCGLGALAPLASASRRSVPRRRPVLVLRG